jgi:uncharacterized protein YdaU (DUF1376 family)
MIRKYYATEKPLPADIQVIQRLLCARTKKEKEAIVTILNEFFTLEEDGWHNARCDAEIARYREGDAERENRENNQRERLRRHREERARLFRELKEHDIVPRYDTPSDELRRLHKQYCNKPVTDCNVTCNAPETFHETAAETLRETLDTAIHNPDTSNQTPIKPPVVPLSVTDTGTCNAPVTLQVAHPVTPDKSKPAVALAVALRKAGISVNAANPQVIALTEQGVSIETALAAVEEAKKSRPDERIALGYIVKILERWSADAKKINVRGADKRDPPDNWWASDAGIDRKGRELGLIPRPMESYSDYRTRIHDEIRKRKENVA